MHASEISWLQKELPVWQCLRTKPSSRSMLPDIQIAKETGWSQELLRCACIILSPTRGRFPRNRCKSSARRPSHVVSISIYFISKRFHLTGQGLSKIKTNVRTLLQCGMTVAWKPQFRKWCWMFVCQTASSSADSSQGSCAFWPAASRTQNQRSSHVVSTFGGSQRSLHHHWWRYVLASSFICSCTSADTVFLSLRSWHFRNGHACHAKDRGVHQSQPSARSATPAPQSERACHQAPRLPRKRPRRHSRPQAAKRATRASQAP